MTSNGTWIEPEWSHGPRTNSLLRFRCTLPIESADVGELGPLHAIVISASATVDMLENADTFPAAGATSGMRSSGSSLCVMRGRGTGPVACTLGVGPWNAGRGIEGRVWRGWPRGGRGPLWRRRGVGGERRGMVVSEVEGMCGWGVWYLSDVNVSALHRECGPAIYWAEIRAHWPWRREPRHRKAGEEAKLTDNVCALT